MLTVQTTQASIKLFIKQPGRPILTANSSEHRFGTVPWNHLDKEIDFEKRSATLPRQSVIEREQQCILA